MREDNFSKDQMAQTSRIIDLIFPMYPYGLTVKGPSLLQYTETSAYRWFCDPETTLNFSLPEETPLVLKLGFTSLLSNQGMSVNINGKQIASFEDLNPGEPYQEEILFLGKKENSLCIEYKTTNLQTGAFAGDPRDLSMIFSEFAILRQKTEQTQLPQNRFSLSSIPHIGDPAANAKLNQEEYEAGKTVLTSLPSVVTMALTTYCNNKIPCVICDRNVRPEAADTQINDDMLEKAKPLLSTASYVLLHCGGESMLSRHFDEVISMISPPTRVSFATNAMLMTKNRADNMLKKDIMAGIVVSLDAATDKTYRIMRPGSKFDTVVSNVTYYIAQAKKLGRTHSNVTLNMTLCEANIHEVPQLVDLAESIGALGIEYNHLNSGPNHIVKTSEGWDWDYISQSDFKDKEFHDDMLLEAYYKAKDKNINISLVGMPFLGKNAAKYQEIVCDLTCQIAFQEGEGQSHWNSPCHKKISPKVSSCFKPWQEAVIQPDGLMRACYFHDISQWATGSLQFSDFLRVWNSDQMVKTREQFLKHSFARSCAESQPCMHRGRI
ncbi:radical SAM/SPASM domain-containing protein [Maridesulfovibrio frigidus]|uniref:radical SAM/SPASM domain-containing protein n=1 Tax=Maridesulfovibrio frigidus TaxID=340956 RepID=UPI0004E0F4D5|nr:radical SAM protein [Maridesulfovibrio frigidus]